MDSSGTKGVRYSRLRDHFGIWTVLYGPRQGKSSKKGIILDGFENMVLILFIGFEDPLKIIDYNALFRIKRFLI